MSRRVWSNAGLDQAIAGLPITGGDPCGQLVLFRGREPATARRDIFGRVRLCDGDVVVSPGAGFGPAGEGYVRMALVENENRIRQAIRQIGRCLM